MSRGYKTISQDFAVMTRIPPITVTLEFECLKSRILHLQHEITQQAHFPNTYIQRKTNIWLLYPLKETSPLQVNPEKHSYKPTRDPIVYTDGSRTESAVASAFCAMRDGEVIHQCACRIGDFNTVYQSEFLAIVRALEWISVQNHSFTRVYSDSLSSLQAIFSHRTKHPLVLEISQLQSLIHKTSLVSRI